MVAQPGMVYQDPAMMGMQMQQPGMVYQDPAMMGMAQPGMVYQDPAMMGMQVMQPGMVAPAVGYDEDPREIIPPYYINKEFNFVVNFEADQIVICEMD